MIFDLQTYAYLGKVRVGSSPSDIAIDYLSNGFS